MFTVIGLGNPGKEYDYTPHNIGRDLVRLMINDPHLTCSTWSKQTKSLTAKGSFDRVTDSMVTFVLPETFMNLSGEALTHEMKQNPEHVIVIYDDIDLPFGETRISFNRGSGGHNGVKSIEQHLKTRTFIRLRVGVCPLDWFNNPRKPKTKEGTNNYLVRKKLSSWYTKKYDSLSHVLVSQIEVIIRDGLSAAMNKYN